VETEPEERQLAETMVKIMRAAGRHAVALLSDMNQPLGYAIGNALELSEAIDTLHGGGVKDFRDHCLTIAAHLLMLGKVTEDEQEAMYLAQAAIKDGRAWQRFRALVEAQGGDVSYIDDPGRLPRARLIETTPSPNTGYLKEINARIYGTTAVYLGAGRSKKEDKIDHAVGITVHHKVGDWIEAGQPLFTIYANDARRLKISTQRLLAAHAWSSTQVEPLPHYYGIIRN
jgi:pyrimidine-nucleoside phosphorylase